MARKNMISEEDLKEKKRKFEQIADNLEVISTEKFLTDNFLPYAWSFNLDRALVDVTGLKPVHRRVLYTMYKDGLSPTANRSKIASLAGRVLVYHPHGNVAVEEAIKNLARPHVFRVPLIDGKGDFGVPGSPGAAGRYIEARLNRAAWINVEEIGENAVRMVPNYDNTTTEPIKVPVRWPISVINGGSGIAIAYAANMPSHNPTEVMKACKALLKDPELDHSNLQKIILGPDFNMGGIVTSNDGIKKYLETGNGSFKIRGQYDVKPGARSSYRIEFYEIPFGTYPEKIIETIQAQIEKGNLKEVASYKDLSDLKHPIRVVIETKPSVNYKKVIQDLFKFTPLESNFSANITTIVDNKPQQSSMKDLLLDFIEFRKQCIFNKTKYNLTKKEERNHLIEGLLKTLLDIDKAIAIIRGSDDTTVAKSQLQAAFAIDEKQAEYVLSLQLRRLTKMDQVELDEEKAKLDEEIAYLNELLTNEETLKSHLLNEFDETLKIIGDERKTIVNNMSEEDFNNSEKNLNKDLRKDTRNLPCFITRFANGSVLKTEEPFVYDKTLKKFEYSPIVEQIKMKTQDPIILVASDGTGYKIPLSYIPEDTVSTLSSIGIKNSGKLVALGKVNLMKTDTGILLGTKLGEAKVVKPEYPNKEEFTVFSLSEGDEIINGQWLGRALTNSYVVSITSSSNILLYDTKTLRPTGAAAGGVRSQKLISDDDEVIYFGWVSDIKTNEMFILSQAQATVKLTFINEIPPKSKGAQGVALHKFKKNETKLIKAFAGEHMIVSVENLHNSVMSPPVSKRAAVGIDFNMKIDMGVSQLNPM